MGCRQSFTELTNTLRRSCSPDPPTAELNKIIAVALKKNLHKLAGLRSTGRVETSESREINGNLSYCLFLPRLSG
jgi:hypothetical protein